jgi:hypothetical protein
MRQPYSQILQISVPLSVRLLALQKRCDQFVYNAAAFYGFEVLVVERRGVHDCLAEGRKHVVSFNRHEVQLGIHVGCPRAKILRFDLKLADEAFRLGFRLEKPPGSGTFHHMPLNRPEPASCTVASRIVRTHAFPCDRLNGAGRDSTMAFDSRVNAEAVQGFVMAIQKGVRFRSTAIHPLGKKCKPR